MLKEDLKKEIDRLNEAQLHQVADFIAHLNRSPQKQFIWQKATAVERAEDFRKWVTQLPKNSPSLSDEAFSRNSIYDE